jgi:5-methyltetrahydropteroyltriglutamate--homocysteine methyltransferase
VLTATKDLMLPTTVTGSWPRPRWFDAQLGGKPFSTCMKDVRFREQFGDALSAVVVDQERAGLDIVSNGDYHQDDSLGGHGWHRYPLERLEGLEGDYFRDSPDLPDYAPGSILNEVFLGWRWPKVVGKVGRNPRNPLDYAKLWRLAQARTNKPVRFGTVSAQGLPLLLDVDPDVYGGVDQRELIWDMSTAMNQELRELAAAGCKVIQVEEPLLHFVALFHPEKTDLIDFLVDAFNHEVSGLDGVEVWVHTCWGNPNMQRGTDVTSYENSIEIYLDRVNADVWTIEAKDSANDVVPLFKPYRDKINKKVAVGVVSHRTLQVESPAEVATSIREALEYIPEDKLVLSSDCGFGRQGTNRLIAFYKASSIAQGANIVRAELGYEQRPVPAADPALQVDVIDRSLETRMFGGVAGDDGAPATQ